MSVPSDMQTIKRLAEDIETILFMLKSDLCNENAKKHLIAGIAEMTSQLVILTRQLRYDQSNDEVYTNDIPF